MGASSTYMTTGKWTVAPGRNVEWPLIIKSDGLHGLDPLTGKNIVAVVAHGHEAHAALLAAAPDLLDALAGLIDFIEIDKLPMNRDALQIARAAIAKATTP